MFGFHKFLEQELRKVPHHLMEELIAKKFREMGTPAPEGVVRTILERILNGNNEPVSWDDGGPNREISISISAEDIIDVERSVSKFAKSGIPEVIKNAVDGASDVLHEALKKNWAGEYELEQFLYDGFRERLEKRWGKAFNLLRMLLVISRELGAETYKRSSRTRNTNRRYFIAVLHRLHARACQVTAEIICLMENGYADGAMARWRTLHEIGIVATLIYEGGRDLAERYVDHQYIESKSAMEEYIKCHAHLGYKALSKREVARIAKNYNAAISKYGAEFASPYGWAAQHLGVKKPTIAQLELAAGRAAMRSYYKMASYPVHANSRGIFFKLSTDDETSPFHSGASNAGFAEPGQNAALTLTQITSLLLGPNWKVDDLVAMKTLLTLRDEIASAFLRADRKLRREEAKNRKKVVSGSSVKRRPVK